MCASLWDLKQPDNRIKKITTGLCVHPYGIWNVSLKPIFAANQDYVCIPMGFETIFNSIFCNIFCNIMCASLWDLKHCHFASSWFQLKLCVHPYGIWNLVGPLYTLSSHFYYVCIPMGFETLIYLMLFNPLHIMCASLWDLKLSFDGEVFNRDWIMCASLWDLKR